MKTLKWIYKTIRSLLFAAILVAGGMFILLYVLLSIPPVHDYVKKIAETQLTEFFGQKVSIGSLQIYPLSEVVCHDIEFEDPYGEKCLTVNQLGAGVNFWKLVFSGDIEVTFIEMLDFNANVYQKKADDPLNIDFIIKAFEPKDKNKPPTKFDLKIHNIVLRRGNIQFSKQWLPKEKDRSKIDFNHLLLKNVNADVALPTLKNEDITIDLRRLAFNEQSGFVVKEISGLVNITPDRIAVNNLNIELPGTIIQPNDLVLNLPKDGKFGDALLSQTHRLRLDKTKVTPSDFKAFLPSLATLDKPFYLTIDVIGNKKDLAINNLVLNNNLSEKIISLEGNISGLSDIKNAIIDVNSLNFAINSQIIKDILTVASNSVGSFGVIERFTDISGKLKGKFDIAQMSGNVKTEIYSNYGDVAIEGEGGFKNDIIDFKGNVEIPLLNASNFIENSVVKSIKDFKLEADASINIKALQDSRGEVALQIGEIGVLDRTITNIDGEFTKQNKDYTLSLTVDDNKLHGAVQGSARLAGADSKWNLHAELKEFDTYNALLTDLNKNVNISGAIDLEATGNDIDNMYGQLLLDHLHIKKFNGKELNIQDLTLSVQPMESNGKSIKLNSDIADIDINGNLAFSAVPAVLKEMTTELLPSLLIPYSTDKKCGWADFNIRFKDIDPLIEFFNIPIFPLTDLSINGKFDGDNRTLSLSSDIPYIQQGKDKLIRDTYLKLNIDAMKSESLLQVGTVYPTNKGDLKLDLSIKGEDENFNVYAGLNEDKNTSFHGNLEFLVSLDKDELTRKLMTTVEFMPTSLYLNSTEWKIGESSIFFTPGDLKVRDFSVRNGNQFVMIEGDSGTDGDGAFKVLLSEVSLDYIFDTLHIEHVTFGGLATGEVIASDIFSKDPKLYTKRLSVENLSYNGAVLGNGDLYSSFNLPTKKLVIKADIDEDNKRVANVDGGLWLDRDSLSFAFDTHGVNVKLVQPFMKAFSSDIRGRASGNLLLYGTFKDIDLTGKVYADNVSLLIDYTNVRYTASDTIYMDPGKIRMPNLRVQDAYGNTATVNGEVRHSYFRRPEFEFDIMDVDNMLCYNTNEKMNRVWYGTIFASGNGKISGKPGIVDIQADMQTEGKSHFTFVLSDEQIATATQFLTFSDRRAEKTEVKIEEVLEEPEFLKKFRKKVKQEPQNKIEDILSLNLRATVTPDVQFNLIMDPVAGDKITATGDGAMQMAYDSKSDELKIYGKYSLEKGSYNFSLQDLILKDFTIKPGSSISFTGDPYRGDLNITAAYKVNTNLTDLDESFASDRELNRTSVPVEALLKVTGLLTNPTIGFDIDLPTVTEETKRKVKSIISTDDMMSRQVLYLVALNRFYSPEYMTNAGGGGEWASVASSTISSQLQNIIGQLTDKFTIAPSLRSDKGDFSDVEFDVALSSSLFNNRLLINGNLGYRDPNNSSTTFVGDFDIEYLLNKKGTFRLKAYNHFNDQNYYLKSALTTQGFGIIWRKDF